MDSGDGNHDGDDCPRSQSSGSHDEGNNRNATTDEVAMHRPWTRRESEEELRHIHLASINLTTIPEDSSSLPISSVWSHTPSLVPFDYEEERKRTARHYRSSIRQKHTGRMAAAICAIFLLAVMAALKAKNQRPAPKSAGDVESIQHPDPEAILVDDGQPSDTYDRPPSVEEDDLTNSPKDLIYESQKNLIHLNYHPIWFSDVNGWQGTSYEDGTTFCKSMSSSRFVCPCEAYCPGGFDMPPFQGTRGDESAEWWWGKEASDWWSPVLLDNQPMLVGVGSKNACLQPGVLNDSNKEKMRYILCCSDVDDGIDENESLYTGLDQKVSKPTMTVNVVESPPNVLSGSFQNTPEELQPGAPVGLTKNEQAALNHMHPQWFSRKDGYRGTTHQEAVEFCNGIGVGGMQLCLPEAYCPNGSPYDGEDNPQPLFLRRNVFHDEQWAPIAVNPNSWLLIGTLHDNPAFTCETYEALHDNQQPLWGFDGSSTELKQYVLCCSYITGNEGSAMGSIAASPAFIIRKQQPLAWTAALMLIVHGVMNCI